MEEEMDLVSIIKKIRSFDTVLQASLLNDKKRELMVEHTEKNVIDLCDDNGVDHLEVKFGHSTIDQALYQQVLFKDNF